MKNRNLYLKILAAILIIASLGFNFNQNRKIKRLISQLDYCESEKSDLEDAVSNLEDELEECKSEKEDSENEIQNQSSNTYYLENDNSDLESRIRNLEYELDDCKDKLRDCN